MEHMSILLNQILAFVMQIFGMVVLLVVLLFPGYFAGIKKGATLKQCTACGKWGKAE